MCTTKYISNFTKENSRNWPSNILSSSLDPEVIWMISSLWAWSWLAIVIRKGTNLKAVMKKAIKISIQGKQKNYHTALGDWIIMWLSYINPEYKLKAKPRNIHMKSKIYFSNNRSAQNYFVCITLPVQ